MLGKQSATEIHPQIAFRFVFWNSKHPSNQIYTEEGQITMDATSKKLLSCTHSDKQLQGSELGWIFLQGGK